MKKIVLNEEERELLQEFVKELHVAKAAFREASILLDMAQKVLWKQINTMWPGATSFNNPPEGDWTITIEKEGVVT